MSGSEATRTRGVLGLAMPLVFSFWFRAAFQWVDTIYASSLGALGDASIAAIGLTAPFEFLMIACWVGTSNGLTSHLAAAMGARQGRKVEQLVIATRRIVRWLRFVFLGLAAALWLVIPHLPLEAGVAGQFRIYGPVLLAGSSLTAFWSILPDSLVKAHNDTRSTMWAGIISTLVNFTLNTVFVFVFHWGIAGIALATVLARLGGLAYALRRAAAHERRRLARGTDTEAGTFARPLRAILSLAVPGGLSFALLAVEGLAINGLLAARADSAALLAAWSIVDRAARFLTMPVIAIGVALLPLAARLWGARDPNGIRREVRTGLLAGAGYVVLFVLPLTVFLAGPVARGLTDAQAAQEAAQQGIRLAALAVALGAPMFLLRSTFEGMQQPRPGLLVSGLRTAIFLVPLAWLGLSLAPRVGRHEIEGLLVGVSLAAGLSSALLLVWMRAFLAERSAELARPGA